MELFKSLNFSCRIFQFNRNDSNPVPSEQNSTDEDRGLDRVPSTSINMNPSSSSNNILNVLSGSFHAEPDEVTDDENILVGLSCSTNNPTNDPRSIVPSSSTGRIGVAAIPNTRFNNATMQPHTRTDKNFIT